MKSGSKEKEKTGYENYRIFYGIPHCHTSASTGKGTAKDAIQHTKDNGLDFIIISDHSSYLKKKSKENKIRWEEQKDTVKKFRHLHKSILPFIGFEYKLFRNLDINVISDKEFIYEKLTISEFIKWLKRNDAIGILNHPGDGIQKIKNNLELNRYITCIETGNGSYPNKYQRYYKNFFYLLDLGWKLAAVNGQDNHRRNWGDSDNVTAVIAKKLNNQSLNNALIHRHTYSTESRTLKVNFLINHSIMGDILKVKATDLLNFSIYAEDLNNIIQRIRVFTNKGSILKESETLSKKKVELCFTIDDYTENSWFVVNIQMVDGREAITSPIFISEV